jgi:single-strand DNA-binding protein
MGVNKAILIGNLGKDPELRYTPGGSAVASFSFATGERYNDRNGQTQKRTSWHNIVAWGKLAELANQYLKKGSSAYIEGRIQYRSWDDRDGNKRYRTEIVANSIEFLRGGPGGGDQGDYGRPPAESQPQYDQSADNEQQSAGGQAESIVDDDLPF